MSALANVTVNAQADAMSDLLDDGYLRLYAGSQPATADTPLSGQTLLAELRFGAIAAPAASAGVLTFNAITPEPSAPATGTTTWFRTLADDGTTGVMDGSVGAAGSGADLELDPPDIDIGTEVSIDMFTHTVTKS